MSGHSHYATIHRQKELKDAQKGKIFSKLAKEIAIAVKGGGGTDPASNFKLRMVMEKAHTANMPKDNVDRALTRGQSGDESIEEATYEGFGPAGVAVVVTTVTDNRNRTGQEIKNIFERAGGNLGGPGSVSFNFETKGFMLAKKEGNKDELQLQLIDLGVEDIEETSDGFEVYSAPDKLSETKKKLEEAGFSVSDVEIYLKPKNLITVSDKGDAQKILSFLDTLNEHDDVQKVYANLDIPEDLIAQIK